MKLVLDCLVGMRGPFNICDVLFENSMVRIEFQGSQLHGRKQLV